MWNEQYEKLSNSEKEELRRLLNYMLSHTYVIRDIYDVKEGMMKINNDYRFVERNFELFESYLSFAGWLLQKDSNYGVISVSNIYEYNRIRLDRNSTLILYTIRLIFEEEREKVALRNEILTTTGQIVNKLITLGLLKKKPSDKDLNDALRLLSNYNIIQKVSGAWEEADAKLLILPSILFVVTNEKISRMYELLEAEENDINGYEAEAATTEMVIRGEEELL